MERKDSQIQFRIPFCIKKEWESILKKRAQNKSALLIKWIKEDIEAAKKKEGFFDEFQ